MLTYYLFNLKVEAEDGRRLRPRRRDDGHLVDDALRLGRRDLVAALAGDARVLVAAAAPVLSSSSADPRLGVDRALLARGHAAVGAAALRAAVRSGAPVRFVVALPSLIFGLGALGLVIASSFVLFRNANALSNMLEFPVWLVDRRDQPLSLLPGWTSADRLGARADLGHPRPLRRGGRSAAPSVVPFLMCRRRSDFESTSRSPLVLIARPPSRRASRQGARDPLAARHEHAPRSSRRRATSRTARSSTGSTGRCTCRRCSAARSSRSCSSPTSVATPGRSPTSSSSSATGARSARSAVFGMALTIGGERWTQTLGSILATPANRAALFLGRALRTSPTASSCRRSGFIVGALLLDFSPAPARCRRSRSSSSCARSPARPSGRRRCARSALPGHLHLREPRVFLMLLLCGVNVPLDRLPRVDGDDRSGSPLTHGIAAAREVAGGRSLADVRRSSGRKPRSGWPGRSSPTA